METLIEKLESIAKVTITSEEFTRRANDYIKKVEHISTPLMSDSELRDIYRKVRRQMEIDRGWEFYCNTIRPILYKRPECKGLWYEVWIDLNESWDEKWLSTFRYMSTDEIVEVCVKYLNEQERFYDSPDYYDMLNKLVAE